PHQQNQAGNYSAGQVRCDGACFSACPAGARRVSGNCGFCDCATGDTCGNPFGSVCCPNNRPVCCDAVCYTTCPTGARRVSGNCGLCDCAIGDTCGTPFGSECCDASRGETCVGGHCVHH